jgi:hypothetical protein
MDQSTFSWAAPPASPSPSPDSERDSLIRAAISRSPFWRWFSELARSGSCGKTSPAYYPLLPTTLPISVHRRVEWRPILDPVTKQQRRDSSGKLLWSKTSTTQTKAMRSPASWPDFGNSGTGARGELWTLSSSTWRSGASVCSLSRVLETGAHLLRYCLSPRACAGILRRAEKRGKTLPAPLLRALRQAADSGRTSSWGGGSSLANALRGQPNASHRPDSDTYVPVISPAIKARDVKGPSSDGDGDGAPLVAHSLRADGFDASEDGTGRGTPLVAFQCHGSNVGEMGTLRSGNGNTAGGVPFVAYGIRSDATREGTAKTPGPDAEGRVRLRDPGMGVSREVAPTLRAMEFAESHANGGGQVAVAQASAVRRLTPRECERLQGFPDDYTLVAYRGKPAADGPRYRALGNSWAVPCVVWIARRLDIVGKAPNP